MGKNIYLKKIIVIGSLLIILILLLYLTSVYIKSNNNNTIAYARGATTPCTKADLDKANASLAKCKTDSSKSLAKCKTDSSTALAKCKTDSGKALSKCKTDSSTALAKCNTDNNSLSKSKTDAQKALNKCKNDSSIALSKCNTDLSNYKTDIETCNTDLGNYKSDLTSTIDDLNSAKSELLDTTTQMNNLEEKLADCYANQPPVQPPVPQNQPSGLQLEIKTSRDLYSGTDSIVVLYFYDDTYTNKTQDKPIVINEINFPFTNYKYNPPYRPIIIKGSADRFEAGKTDKFLFPGNYSIDFSKPIWLGLESAHDPSYTISDSWKVESVIISIVNKDGSQSGRNIVVNQWLAYGQYIDISQY